MKLNKWEQAEVNLFAKTLPQFVEENGIKDYRKVLYCELKMLNDYTRTSKKNYRIWTCDALCVGKNYLTRHQI